jgi:hypothetical protein
MKLTVDLVRIAALEATRKWLKYQRWPAATLIV